VALDHPHRVLQCTPLAAALHREFPSIRLELLVDEAAAPVLAGNPDLDGVLALCSAPRRGAMTLWPMARHLRGGGYTLAVDLTGSWRSALLCRAAARARIGYRSSSLLRRGLAAQTGTIRAGMHQRDAVGHYLMVGTALGVADLTDRRLRYRVEPDEREEAGARLHQWGLAGGRYIVADLSAFDPSAHWPAQLMAEFLGLMHERTGWNALVVGDPAREADLVAAAADRPPVCAAGRLSLRQLAAVVESAGLVVGAEPTTIELAAAMNVPAIYLNGGVSSEVVTPARPLQVTVRPYCQCQVDAVGRPICMTGPTWCMRAVSPRQLSDAAAALLGPVRAQPSVAMELS
jgi:heptosyltransferase-3